MLYPFALKSKFKSNIVTSEGIETMETIDSLYPM